jgi:predicted alpha/beta superfamily hydrolase
MSMARRLAALVLAAPLLACGGGGGGAGNNLAVATPAPPVVIADLVALPWNTQLDSGPGHTISGDVRIIPSFPMPQLNRARRIWIYLPAGYAASSARYPVLYLQDGQNVFDAGTSYAGEWGVDEALLQMEKEAAPLPTIVVAIDNGGTARNDEYLPANHARDYVDFIVQTLKPYIDSHYRTDPGREHTAIGGSSYGAYLSLYAGLTRQDIFGKVLSFSNVALYDGGALAGLIASNGRRQDLRIYMDIGALEEGQFPGVVASDQQTLQQLLAAGFGPQQVRLLVDPLGHHNEVSWRRRFPAAWRGMWSADRP